MFWRKKSHFSAFTFHSLISLSNFRYWLTQAMTTRISILGAFFTYMYQVCVTLTFDLLIQKINRLTCLPYIMYVYLTSIQLCKFDENVWMLSKCMPENQFWPHNSISLNRGELDLWPTDIEIISCLYQFSFNCLGFVKFHKGIQ